MVSLSPGASAGHHRGPVCPSHSILSSSTQDGRRGENSYADAPLGLWKVNEEGQQHSGP